MENKLPQNVSDYIFVPQDDSKSITNIGIFTYTNKGNKKLNSYGGYTPSSANEEYAKKIVREKYTTFYIKTNGNVFYNPRGIYSTNISPLNNTWKFEEVSPKVFELYIKFLNSENEMFLDMANKER